MYKNKEKLHEIPLTTKLYIQTINAKIKKAVYVITKKSLKLNEQIFF